MRKLQRSHEFANEVSYSANTFRANGWKSGVRIQSKLFLIILCSCAALVLGMYALTQWTVDKGLLKYVNTREHQAHLQIIEQLAVGYQNHGSWDFLKNNPRLIDWLARNAAPVGQPPPGSFRPHDESRRPPPPRRFSEGEARRPPPRGLREQSPFSARPGFGPPRPEPTDNASAFEPRAPIAVLNLLKQAVVGEFDPDNDDTRLTPITLDQGDTVIGWFAFTPPDRLSEDFDLALAEELQTGFLSISLVMLLLSAALALPLSYLLLRRIKHLATATRQVAKGEFSHRLKVTSSDELGQLSRDFNELAKTLEENESTRRRWFADISHELRTPLSVASGELEAMIDGVRPASTENLQSAHDEIKHLHHLINDLYEFSSAELGALQYQKTELDLRALLEHEVHHFESVASDQGLTVTLESASQAIPVWADPHRLKQLIRNLLTNAIKYTDAPGQIRIRVDADQEKIHVMIDDSAPGVASRYLEKLFDPLFRVDASRNRKSGGSGLGLGICKQIVLAHGGTIHAAPSSLGGLAIHIELPLSRV